MLPQRALRNESPVRWFARPSTATIASTPPVKEAEPASEPAADVSVEPRPAVEPRESVRGAEETENAVVDTLGTPQLAPIAADEADDTPIDDAAMKQRPTKKQATKAATLKQSAAKDTTKRAPRQRT